MQKQFIIFLFLLFLNIPSIQAQQLSIGKQYLANRDSYINFKFKKNYEKVDNNYITVYKIYHPTKGSLYLTITATHLENEKKIEVLVEDAKGGIFSEINQEKFVYTKASSKPFGYRGSVGALSGNSVPNQLMLQFRDQSFTYVNIINVAGSHENNDFEFFVLDKSSQLIPQGVKSGVSSTSFPLKIDTKLFSELSKEESKYVAIKDISIVNKLLTTKLKKKLIQVNGNGLLEDYNFFNIATTSFTSTVDIKVFVYQFLGEGDQYYCLLNTLDKYGAIIDSKEIGKSIENDLESVLTSAEIFKNGKITKKIVDDNRKATIKSLQIQTNGMIVEN